MKKREELKCLLVQARDDKETIEEEKREFYEFAGISPEQLDTLNLFETSEFEPSLAGNYDAIFAGGSSSEGSDFIEWKKPYVINAGKLFRYAYEHKIPTFASCGGFQIVAIELGGTVIKDEEHMEMGSYPIHLTEEGKNDPLFHDMSDGFLAISGHAKRASELPPGAVNLAFTDLCPFHAFKMPDAPFYATQFHPEVTAEDLAGRITRYKEVYLDDDEALDAVIANTEPTPEANKLIGRFVERIVLGV